MKTYQITDFQQNKDFRFTIMKDHLRKDFPIHSHSFTELMIVLSGTALHHVNQDTLQMQKGTVLVVDENIDHSFSHVQNLEYYNILFFMNEITASFQDLRKIPGFLRLFTIEPLFRHTKSGYSSYFQLTDFALSDLKVLLNLICQEQLLSENGSSIAARSYLSSTLAYLSRQYDLQSYGTPSFPYDFSQTISYIENHYTDFIAISELAEHAKISLRHYNRLFKSTYGITPMEYIISLRIKKSQTLLTETILSVEEISSLCGFYDSSHFSRTFKSRFGLSPLQYRHHFSIK